MAAKNNITVEANWSGEGTTGVEGSRDCQVTVTLRKGCSHPADSVESETLLMECPDCHAECSGDQVGDDQLCYDNECPLHRCDGLMAAEECTGEVTLVRSRDDRNPGWVSYGDDASTWIEGGLLSWLMERLDGEDFRAACREIAAVAAADVESHAS